MLLLFGKAAICWSAQKQKTVATSSVEAEYVALGSVFKEALWVLALLRGLGCTLDKIYVNIDSNGAIALARNIQLS